MDTNRIIFVIAMVFLAVRVYQKYIRKDKPEGTAKKDSFSSVNKDDEYEPYSKK